MDIQTFKLFLESQRGGFETFLKGCKDLNREQMRLALSTHTSKMIFSLATELPLVGTGTGVSSLLSSTTSARSARRSVTSPFKSPYSPPNQSPTASNQHSKPPGPIPEIPSLFKRHTNYTAQTSTSKRSTHSDFPFKISPYGSIRTPSGSARSVLRGGTIGGAGRLFKPVTPTDKSYGRDDDSSAGSVRSSDDSYRSKRSSHKRTTSTKSGNSMKSSKNSRTPKSPFEIAARGAERKKPYPESESSSDFDIPLRRRTLRKVSSAKSQNDHVTPKKSSGGMMDGDDDYVCSEEEQETPSKKQKTGGVGSATRKTPIEIDLTV